MTSVPMASTKLTMGRSGVSGITATIFGSSGFLGKYVVNRFGKIGCKCLLPYRGDEVDVRHLKLTGDLGVVSAHEMSIRSVEEIEAAVEGSNVVINLLGKHFETTRWSFTDVNTTFPGALAQVAADMGVERFVHVSALGASVDAPSAWARSKALGEQAVRDSFPEATILRPATIFGDEDKFLNRIAKLSQLLPVYPLSSQVAAAKQQPVYCDDVAAAVFAAATSPAAMGKTFDLAGPKIYTNKEICDFVLDTIREEDNVAVLPHSIAYSIALGINQLPNPWMTADAVKHQSVDLLQPADTLSFADLGITETESMESIGERYLMRFRKMSMFVDNDEIVKTPQ